MQPNQAIPVKELKGTYTALITPMHEPGPGQIKGDIDGNKLGMLVNDQIAAGVNGLVVCGTTGQDCTISHQEQVALARFVNEIVANRVQLIAGAGSNATEEAVELSRDIEAAIGPTTFLHATGYKNNPTQRGLIAHFSTVADNLTYDESNVIIYNVPGRTGSYIEPETAITLAQHPKIIALKQAVDFSKKGAREGKPYRTDTKMIINDTDPNKFRLVSGEDGLIAELFEMGGYHDMGGYGVISASANAAPAIFKRITDAGLRGTEGFDEMRKAQREVMPIVDLVFEVKNPIPLAHIFDTALRLPMTREPEIVEPLLEEVLAQFTPEQLGIDLNQYRREKIQMHP